jgi:hypothetical protein
VRNLLVVSPIVGALVLVLLVPPATSAPALKDRVVRYEYGELRFCRTPVGPPPAAPVVAVRWVTVGAVVEGAGWNDLAAKLKAPAGKDDNGGMKDILRVFERLRADKWEVYDRSVATDVASFVWSLRRKLP